MTSTIMSFESGLIKEIQEWATVYFVKFFNGSPVFVSKKDVVTAQGKNVAMAVIKKVARICKKRQIDKRLSWCFNQAEKAIKTNKHRLTIGLRLQRYACQLMELNYLNQALVVIEKAFDVCPLNKSIRALLRQIKDKLAEFMATPILTIALWNDDKPVGYLHQINDFTWIFKGENSTKIKTFMHYLEKRDNYAQQTFRHICQLKYAPAAMKKANEFVRLNPAQYVVIMDDNLDWIDVRSIYNR